MAPRKEKQEVKELDTVDSVLNEYVKVGTVLRSRSGDDIKAQDVITTSSFEFDQRLGGGFRDSGWSRFYSNPECGKTSMGLRWGRNWQQRYEDGFVIYFNAEGRVNKDLLDRSEIDTNPSKFRIVDTNKFDTIFDITQKLILSNKENRRYFFIVDSTDACERAIDAGKEFSDPEKIAGGAALISVAGKRLSLLFNVTGHHLFMCSQVRAKMTQGPMAGKGSGTGVSGGNAAGFYSSLVGEIKKPWSERWILENPSDDKSKIIGRIVEIKLEKTPNETTGSTVFYPVKYGLKGGVWRAYEALMVAQACGIVKKEGAWFNFEESIFADMEANSIKVSQKNQGEKAARDVFDSNPELVEYVLQKGAIIYNAKRDMKQ